MKTLFACLLLIFAGNGLAQEVMTALRFSEIVATAADSTAMRPELAGLPVWKEATCSMVIKLQSGQVLKETSSLNTKTIAGKYIVTSLKFLAGQRTSHTIIGYDEKASALRQWELSEGGLVEGTLVFDPETKTCAVTSRTGDGFMAITTGISSATEMKDHTEVFKDGQLWMTQDTTVRPAPGGPKVGKNGKAGGNSPAHREPDQAPAGNDSNR